MKIIFTKANMKKEKNVIIDNLLRYVYYFKFYLIILIEL